MMKRGPQFWQPMVQRLMAQRGQGQPPMGQGMPFGQGRPPMGQGMPMRPQFGGPQGMPMRPQFGGPQFGGFGGPQGMPMRPQFGGFGGAPEPDADERGGPGDHDPDDMRRAAYNQSRAVNANTQAQAQAATNNNQYLAAMNNNQYLAAMNDEMRRKAMTGG